MKYYVVDAFTDEIFKGNPAGVCVLEKEIDPMLMQKIASENNLSETAFVLKNKNIYDLRWFTPKGEIDLCGHATLATGFVISNDIEPGKNQMEFQTASGILTVTRKNDLFEMDFPNRELSKIDITNTMIEALGVRPKEAYLSRDYFFVLENEKQVASLNPDMSKMKLLKDGLGIIITAKGEECDFVSRYFCPELAVDEDPVTGSSHCNLIPYWSARMNKTNMTAKQLSKRSGVLYCELCEERVKIRGKGVLYLKGEIYC